MTLGIHLYLADLSFYNIVSLVEYFGVERARLIVSNWVQKADAEPRAGRDPDRIALDETVVKVSANGSGSRLWSIQIQP